ncbi:MAG: hypothetical protein JJU45_12155, partial [Acidimicrobiia bacterium]|nr:hypothetical protein [Acidimicrobiia bacterium]
GAVTDRAPGRTGVGRAAGADDEDRQDDQERTRQGRTGQGRAPAATPWGWWRNGLVSAVR